jgi:hypothetical protein
MGRRAANFVAKEFGLGLTVARYASLYSELLDRTQSEPSSVSKSESVSIA